MNEGNQRDVSNSVNVKGTAGVWTSFLGNIVSNVRRLEISNSKHTIDK